MHGKLKSVLSALCIATCLFSIPVPYATAFNADSVAACSDDGVMPILEYINDADCQFSISKGEASVNAWVRGYTGIATKSKIVVNLQQKSGLTWKTIKTWSDEQNSRRATVTASQTVSSGKSYRTVTVVTVWCGDKSESQTLTSKSIKA